MAEFRRNYPRLVGLLLIVVGIVVSIGLRNSYRTGNSFNSLFPFVAPVVLLLGLGTLIEPRLLLAHEDSSIEVRYKFLSYALMVVGAVIGAYLRFVVFKDWQ